MANRIPNEYAPDYVSPPGDTLAEIIESRHMTQAELAVRMGRPTQKINDIIKGRLAITPETALQLEYVLGVPASFWNNRERRHQESLARAVEEKRLQDQVAWLKKFPVSDMIKLRWIEKREDEIKQVSEMLTFFGVASPNEWRELWIESSQAVAYRRSPTFKGDPASVSAWLRRGEIEAQGIRTEPYNRAKFRENLQRIRALTAESPSVFGPKMRRLCAEAGVALVFVPELPKTRVSGITRWLSKDKALIQLSLRHKKNDHLWFNFFHEVGHVVLHGKRDIFIEDSLEDGKEEEADRFAADLLIPPTKLRRFLAGHLQPTEGAILSFAEEIGIAPGILVGRLQHDKILPFKSRLNKLKKTYRFKAEDE